MSGKQKLLSISEAAERLGRSPKTLREYEKTGLLPAELFPQRAGPRKERAYSSEQVELIREWMECHGLRSGMNMFQQRAATA